MVSNPSNKNSMKRLGKDEKRKQRFDNYKNMKVLSSKFVRDMENEIDERPMEVVSCSFLKINFSKFLNFLIV